MKSIFPLLAFVIFWSCTDKPKEVNFQKLDLDEAFIKAKQENKLIMVDFFSETCMPCWKLLRTVFKNPEYGLFINNNFISLRITPENENNDIIRKQYGVIGLPTVIFFNSNGDEVDRICGYNGKADQYFQTIKDFVMDKNTLHNLIQIYQADSLNVKNNFNLAMKYIDRWEIEKSDQYFQNVLKLDPDDNLGFHEQSHLNLAIMNVRENNDILPIKSFIETYSNPEFLGIAYGYLLNYYDKMKDTTKYLETCETVIRRIPEIDVAYWRLINYYESKQDTDMVLKTLEKTVKNLPNNAGYLNQYAWAIYELKLKDQYAKAIDMAAKAVQLEPVNDHIWDTLGWLYHETGDIEHAIQAMEKAYEINPERKKYKENIEKFKSEKLNT